VFRVSSRVPGCVPPFRSTHGPDSGVHIGD